MKRFKKRPSPAMIVAMTALFISLVGTAFAGPIAEISGLNKKDKRTVRKISRNISGKVSNRRITKRAPGLSVAAAQNANVANVAALANTVLDDAITSGKIKDADVTTEDLANAAATLAKLADNSVDSSKVVNDSLAAADLGPNSVGSSEIATSAVGETEVGSNAIDSDEIRNGGLFAVDISTFSATGTFNFPSLAAGTCERDLVVISGAGDTANDSVLVTANADDLVLAPSGGGHNLVVLGQGSNVANTYRVVVCNPSNAAVDPPNTRFYVTAFAR